MINRSFQILILTSFLSFLTYISNAESGIKKVVDSEVRNVESGIKIFADDGVSYAESDKRMSDGNQITLHLIETSDVHGCFFPYDFISGKPKAGSLARITTYIKQLRKESDNNVVLLDNGDILQGQPVCYYSNYVRSSVPNIAASVINFMGYDAETVGNHDIETGHAVYDKWAGEVNCPMLGANIINTTTNRPYFKPYTIIDRSGVRIAVIGMLTPAIPNWLEDRLWQGLYFDDIVKSAAYWTNYVKEHEHPDMIVGLFHSGWEGGIKTDKYVEDEAQMVAEKVPGFDIVFFGHDHKPHNSVVKGAGGNDVLCLDPANNAIRVAQADVKLQKDENGKYEIVSKAGKLVDVIDFEVDPDYMSHFSSDIDSVKTWVNRKIGVFSHAISTRDSYFGNSAFNDFIMNMQMKITGADITFNAPLSLDATIDSGAVTVADMFKLYKYENGIYVMRLTGEEIQKYLEMSYDQWCNTMKSPDDHLLLFATDTRNDSQRMGFKNLFFNFDAAAGIDYVVDVTKPDGQKVKILRMTNGKLFDKHKYYKVAVNSYRGNGGGELLTKGAGIPKDSLQKRIIWRSQYDQRHYLMKEIESEGYCNPQPNYNWKFIPEKWTNAAAKRDRQLLFGINEK